MENMKSTTKVTLSTKEEPSWRKAEPNELCISILHSIHSATLCSMLMLLSCASPLLVLGDVLAAEASAATTRESRKLQVDKEIQCHWTQIGDDVSSVCRSEKCVLGCLIKCLFV